MPRSAGEQLSENAREYVFNTDPILPAHEFVLCDTGEMEFGRESMKGRGKTVASASSPPPSSGEGRGVTYRKKNGLLMKDNLGQVVVYLHVPTRRKVILAFLCRMKRVRRASQQLKNAMEKCGMTEMTLFRGGARSTNERKFMTHTLSPILKTLREYSSTFMKEYSIPRERENIALHCFKKHFKVFVQKADATSMDLLLGAINVSEPRHRRLLTTTATVTPTATTAAAPVQDVPSDGTAAEEEDEEEEDEDDEEGEEEEEGDDDVFLDVEE